MKRINASLLPKVNDLSKTNLSKKICPLNHLFCTQIMRQLRKVPDRHLLWNHPWKKTFQKAIFQWRQLLRLLKSDQENISFKISTNNQENQLHFQKKNALRKKNFNMKIILCSLMKIKQKSVHHQQHWWRKK